VFLYRRGLLWGFVLSKVLQTAGCGWETVFTPCHVDVVKKGWWGCGRVAKRPF
jgi:hypothetical protein